MNYGFSGAPLPFVTAAVEGDLGGVASFVTDAKKQGKLYSEEFRKSLSDVIFLAAQRRQVAIVDFLLGIGAEGGGEAELTHARDAEGRTALHVASAFGDRRLVSVLLSHGASILAKDSYSQVPLHVAIACKHRETVRLLVQQPSNTSMSGALPSVEKAHPRGASRVCSSLRVKDGAGRTPLCLILALVAEGNDSCGSSLAPTPSLPIDARLSALLGRCPAPSCSVCAQSPVAREADFKGRTPLHYCVASLKKEGTGGGSGSGGTLQVLHSLLDLRSPVNARDGRGRAAIHLAAESGNAEAVELLLRYNANVNARDIDGVTPLALASASQAQRCVDVLLELGRADPDIEDREGRTPLMRALVLGNVEICERLAMAGASLTKRDRRGRGLKELIDLCPSATCAGWARKAYMTVLSEEQRHSIKQRVSTKSVLPPYGEDGGLPLLSSSSIHSLSAVEVSHEHHHHLPLQRSESEKPEHDHHYHHHHHLRHHHDRHQHQSGPDHQGHDSHPHHHSQGHHSHHHHHHRHEKGDGRNSVVLADAFSDSSDDEAGVSRPLRRLSFEGEGREREEGNSRRSSSLASHPTIDAEDRDRERELQDIEARRRELEERKRQIMMRKSPIKQDLAHSSSIRALADGQDHQFGSPSQVVAETRTRADSSPLSRTSFHRPNFSASPMQSRGRLSHSEHHPSLRGFSVALPSSALVLDDDQVSNDSSASGMSRASSTLSDIEEEPMDYFTDADAEWARLRGRRRGSVEGAIRSLKAIHSSTPPIQSVDEDEESFFRHIFQRVREGKRSRVIQILEAGCPIDLRDAEGNTPLHHAAMSGHKKVVKELLRRGGDLNAVNFRGNTVLHFCYGYNWVELGDYLRGKGADDRARNMFGMNCYEGMRPKNRA